METSEDNSKNNEFVSVLRMIENSSQPSKVVNEYQKCQDISLPFDYSNNNSSEVSISIDNDLKYPKQCKEGRELSDIVHLPNKTDHNQTYEGKYYTLTFFKESLDLK